MATNMYCRHCGYDLRGQVESDKRCPECGREFDPNNPKTFCIHPPHKFLWKVIRRVAVGLLLIMILGAGSWGWLYWGWYREQTALAALHAGWSDVQPIGGPYIKGYLGPAGFVLDRVHGVTLLETTDFAPLRELTYLEYLDMRWSQVTDADLSYIKELTKLRELKLFYTQITDGGLVHIQRLTRLEYLSLSYTQITDAGLIHLRELTNLENLYLDHTKVTDKGLTHLRGLTKLHGMSLEETGVTDTGLVHLRELKGLILIQLSKKNITDMGIKELHTSLPETVIDWK